MKLTKRRVILIHNSAALREQCQNHHHDTPFSFVGFYNDIKTAFLSLPVSRPEIVVVVVDDLDETVLRNIGRIKNLHPSVKILVHTDIDEHNVIIDLLTIGLAGLASVPSSFGELINNLQAIEKGEYPASRMVTRRIFESFQLNKFADLSIRQNEILRLMVMGATHVTIAEKLRISKDTAKTHMRNLYRKLQVHSKAEALAKAVEEKMVLVI